MKRISILDYGAGNIFSIKNAVEKCGYKAILTSDFDQILKSTHLIFPGVGSFDNCMQKLKDKNIFEKLKLSKTKKFGFLVYVLGCRLYLITVKRVKKVKDWE